MDDTPVAWARLSHTGTLPTKRSGHSLTTTGAARGFLFGGIDLKTPPGPNADLFEFELGATEIVWSKPASVGGPSARWRHTATALPNGDVFVFGGFASATARLNDAWVYSPSKSAWLPAVAGVRAETKSYGAWPRVKRAPSLLRAASAGRQVAARAGEAEEGAKEKGTSGSAFLEDFGVPLDDPLAEDSNPLAPTPRGAHSAVLIGEHVFIFGGYGGSGYGRRDVNDVVRLNVERMEWVATEPPGGTPPEPRSGHIAVASRTTMLVFGGWSGTAVYNDMYALNTETMTWASVASGRHGPARWNAAAVAVAAVPNWQVFVFGGAGKEEDIAGEASKASGSGAGGAFLGDTLLFDTGRMEWKDLGALVAATQGGQAAALAAASATPPPLPGDLPRPRSDAAVVYDSERKRVVVFGGWANRWYSDAAALSVGAVVGPPYAVLSIAPVIGPITGGARVVITGMGFEAGQPATVRFTQGRKFTEVQGVALSATELEVLTPSFEHIAPGTVDVRVSLRGGLLTITRVAYTFFLVSDAAKSYAFGPGLLKGLTPAQPVSFVVQARDTSNGDRATGGDVFVATVFRVGADGKRVEGSELPDVTVRDDGNGRHVVTYTAPEAGEYSIDLSFAGTFGGKGGPVRGSPFSATFAENAAKDANKMSGPLVLAHINALAEAVGSLARSTLEGIARETPSDTSLDVLLTVKNHLSAVTSRDAEVRLELDTAAGALAAIKREAAAAGTAATNAADKSLAPVLAKIDKAAATWDEARRESPKCRAAIAPLVKTFSANTRKDLEAFEALTVEYAKRAEEAPAFWQFETGYEAAIPALDAAGKELTAYLKRVERMHYLATTFEFPQLLNETNRLCKAVGDDIDEMRKLWAHALEAREFIAASRARLWSELKPEDLEEAAKAIQKRIKTGGTRKTRASNAFKGLDKLLRDFLSTVPLITALRHKSMRPRHWTLLQKATGKEFTPPHADPALKLQGLLELNLHEFTVDVEEICDQASKEEKMEETLARLGETWAALVFLAEPYKAGSDVMLLRISEDDFETLEADQLAVQGMMASRYLATFEVAITGWQRALSTNADIILSLTDIQRKWSYLEPLFIGSDEVRRELPEDATRFEGIDRDVKAILKEMHSTLNVKAACNKAGLVAQLDGIIKSLDLCEKSLAEFLAGKQRQFPRFYFVSKSDLLDILSNGSQPKRILQHITKVFLQTDTLRLEGGGDGPGAARPRATGWKASVGVEEVEFTPPVTLEGKVEVYLQTALDGQQGTLQRLLVASLKRRPGQKRIEWLTNKDSAGRPSDPAQLSLLVSGMEYVTAVETAFDELVSDKTALQRAYERSQADLADLVRLTQTNLSKPDRTRVMCMITLDAHGRDILQKMLLEGVTNKKAFQWQSQLKQRWVNGETQLHIADARFSYSYEYLGNGPRLVVTPLTDRIYVTATQALNLKMGCAPAGPAGTGKTETTKDLANALAITCYVFNCSPEMDYQSLGNIFKGLSASGTWGCFDEFNRLVPEVLSVCSVQFKAVCDAIRGQRNSVVIEGTEVALKWTAGAFITMNPGYLGRSELPEGLKSLFRPITVMVPDLILICENMLMAEGFVEAKLLASKFFSLYYLLSQLLSKQSHYDWGLRAIKSVLVVAGSFKRAEPDLPEQALLCRALRDFNTPKIVKQDEVIFFGLLGDLFPGIDPPRKVDVTLEDAVVAACAKRGLDADDLFRLKVVQLEELLQIRHCVFVMGPPGAGKTSCWQMLQGARAELKRRVKAVDLDPKAVTPEELYGFIHPSTREWKDGLLSKIMRDLGAEPGEDAKWIVLDGDLDANWIESMNSVMDDNKMLTLASNERIPLKGHMRMVFEIRDLNHATPATVSRAGIIYISTNTGTQWRSLVKSWLLRLEAPEAVRTILRDLFARYCAPSLLFIKKECKPMVPVEDVTLVTNLLRLLKVTLTPALLKKLVAEHAAEMEHRLDTYFVFCALWAFGSALSLRDGEDYRARFSDFWRGEFKSVRLPSRDSAYDYWLDPATLNFEPWKSSPYFSVVTYDSRKTPMSQVTVPTPETCSVTYWMELLVAVRDPVMLVGYAGCGKTQLVQGLLATQKPEERLSHNINFNFFTDARALQSIMESPLEKKTGTNYGPPGQASLVYYLDDFNLPEVDRYDTQSAIALVREHFDYGHWYDRGKLQLRNISNCQYIASMNPTAGSFVINPRMQRHFFTLAIGFPGPTSLHTIYSTFLEGHLRTFSEEVQGAATALLGGALQLHGGVMSTFRKSATNFHYEFNIRHLSNVFQGLLQAAPNEFKTVDKLAQLWIHESERVYGDRLVSLDDLAKYRVIAQATAKKKFPQVTLNSYFGDNADPLIFCHFAEAVGEKCYDKVTHIDRLRTTLNESLREYNENFAAMNLVLFEDAMKHVCRIARIVLNPSGHALLVGVGGSGKQSLSRLAAYICSYRVYQITISGSYSVNDLKEDLKVMFNIAGIKDEGVMFLFTDSQITNERFLVSLNDLLASGNIPELFTPEELDNVINALVPRVKAAGLTPDRPVCWNFFLECIKRNLHVVLCFSPVGEEFRTRAKRFPALVNSTVIDWFQPWPRDALYSVGTKFLASVEGIPSDAVREGIEKFMPFSFETVNKAAARYSSTDRRHVYTTPKSYLELLKLYASLLKSKRVQSDSAISRLANGLAKLRETGEAVSRIEEELKIKLAEAEVAKEKATGIATEVAANKAIVEEETNKANAIAADAAKIAEEANLIKADAERDLAAALPAVERAMAALNTLDKKSLGECSKMTTPPPGVEDIFAAVVVLLANVHKGVACAKTGKVADKDRTWAAAKKQVLTDVAAFLQTLMEYKAAVDDGVVSETAFRDVRAYLELPHFNVDAIMKKNSAAAGITSWVINIVAYRDIVVTVEPKKQKAAAAAAEAAEATAKKEAAEILVAELTATLNTLIEKLNAAEAEKAAAEAIVSKGKAKADLANRLTNALADENVRWAAAIGTLTEEQEMLVGDTLLAAAFISYIGPFTKKYRDSLMAESWVPFLETAAAGSRIPMSPRPNPLAVLTTDAQVAVWNSEGLPDDTVSIENGCIVNNTARWPLMIDPQLQGITWVREREKAKGLIVVRLEQKDLLRKLEAAIERGTPVLVENMGERIDAVLGPVVARQLIKKGTRSYLKLGDKEIEFNPAFRLYLHTKLSNPHYPPEVQAEACLVNFTVTEAGLEDQLLALTVFKERPDLASLKTELIKQQNAFKIQMKELEDGILSRLANAEGDITEDSELIESLEKSKKISIEISEKQAIAKVTEQQINVTSEKYRPVAHRAALLFFLMNDLFKCHTYYIYSLNAFVTIFTRAIDLVSGPRNPQFPEDAPVAAIADAAPAAIPAADGAVSGASAPAADAAAPAAADAAAPSADAAAAPAADAAAAPAAAATPAAAASAAAPAAPAAAEGVAASAPAAAPVRVLTDDEIVERNRILKDSSTLVAFNYMNRGMFERDKITIAAQLCLKIMVDAGELTEAQVRTLVVGPTPLADAGPLGQALSAWLPEAVWPRVRALETIKPGPFETIGEDMQNDSQRWRDWFDNEKPEVAKLPSDYRDKVKPFARLLLLRAMRPDRLVAALTAFVSARLGPEFVVAKPFDMAATFAESSRAAPMFFVLFAGVDPTVWVESLGKKLGFTVENGKFMNISMGQGQEGPAMKSFKAYSESGGWLMLQNVHLMQSWLPSLERQLEIAAETAHEDFRCFISAEPPPLAYLKNMPESLMQSCIKVANEAPADLLSNLTRSWANFSQERIDSCAKPTEFKACLFTLVWYHAIVLGRRRFGQQGWSRKYAFNTGDLSVCANVLLDYVNNNKDGDVPYEDLRYIFGEIMYGGHITDAWDRRTNNTYLSVYLKPDILHGAALGPGFNIPLQATLDFAGNAAYFSSSLPAESPPMFGLHPNAEIGYLTTFADDIFKTIISLGGGSSSAASGGAASGVRAVLNNLLERLPENFQLLDIEARATPLLSGASAPYVIVAMQECSRMNELLDEIRRSLVELRKGLDGLLNMSEPMEDMVIALGINMVPGRNPFHKCSWERYAWPSKRGLASWFVDLLRRVDQLSRWSSTLETPLSLWLPGIFNPMAILTAIMQVTARSTGLPLDKMAVDTHVTTMLSPEQATAPPENGMFVHGLFMEGARWAVGEEAGEPAVVGHTPCAGFITDSRLKQLLPQMPLLYLRAVPVEPSWIPTSVGHLRLDPGIYECPVYVTTFRGPTYVFLSTLRSKDPTSKWVLAGCALVLQEDD